MITFRDICAGSALIYFGALLLSGKAEALVMAIMS